MNKITLKNIYNEEVTIEIVEQKDADFITHSSTFHADEVMSTVMLLNKFGSIKLARVNEVENKNAFIFDIGFGEFDHHGIDFEKVRENGIYLSDNDVEILKKYNIDYDKYVSLSSLIFDIESILNEDTDVDDLEEVSRRLAELNYYNNTNK